MRARIAVPLLAAALVLLSSAPALAAQTIYYVQGTGDAPTASCAPMAAAAGISAARCDTLRAAVAAANANAGGVEETDVIFLQASGIYQLTQPSELALTDEVSIVGRGPRTTTVAGNGSTRVFSVGFDVTVGLSRLAIVGGRAPSGDGGNILNAGSLLLSQARVSGGAAQAGGGIGNYGTLSMVASLVDNNDATTNGAGLLNRGIDAQAHISLVNSTIALNRAGTSGAGIASVGSPLNLVQLSHTTVARNLITGTGSGAGIYAGATGEQVFFNGSIVANNTGGDVTNCGGAGTFVETAAGSNITNLGGLGDCNFADNGTIGLGEALSNQGGDTDVLTIDPLFLAKNAVTPCFMPTDQRNASRPSSTCDAGAFQEGAVAPPIDSGPETEPGDQPPVVTPTAAPPIPTPAPTPEPTPEFRESVVVEPVRGTVLVCPRRPTQCSPLRAGETIPFGATVDTKRGTVELTSLSSAGGKPQKAQFSDGIFRVTQSGAYTELTLTEALASCSSRARTSQSKKPKSRRLWGDGKGKFRTKGRYAAATVRGTRWLTQDTCAGTLIRVTQGTVNVRDNVLRKTVIVRKGKRYLAKPRR